MMPRWDYNKTNFWKILGKRKIEPQKREKPENREWDKEKAMYMMRQYTGQNVYDALQERFKLLFEEFDNIFVSFSGGKDSGILLNLALDFQQKYYPQKKIIHLEGKTQTRRLSEKYQLEMRSREYYCNKYGYNFKRLAKKERQYCMFKSMFFYIGRKKLRAAEYRKIIKFWNKKISSLEAQPVNRKEEQTLC